MGIFSIFIMVIFGGARRVTGEERGVLPERIYTTFVKLTDRFTPTTEV